MGKTCNKIRKAYATISILLFSLIIIPLFDMSISNCALSSCQEYNWGYNNGTFDQYDANPDYKTPEGISYDPSGLPISPELIDRLTNEVEFCLSKSINRYSFVVKIANDWIPSYQKDNELLPVLAPIEGCDTKGLPHIPGFPCRWRAGIKCPNILITTPSFYLYKDVLIRFTQEIDNPWIDPHFAKCATPSTTPMSDGSDPLNGLAP